MRMLLPLAAAAVLFAGCGTATEEQGPSASGEWSTATVDAVPGADSPTILATEGDDVLVVTVSDDGVLRSGLSSDGGDFETGEPLEIGRKYVWLGGAVRHGDGWFALGSGGTARVDGDDELLFEPVGFRSDDGLVWEEVPVDGFAGPAELNALVEVDGSLVAVGAYRDEQDPSMGGFRATAWHSNDGATWTEAVLPDVAADDESFASGVAVAGDRALAVGSTDGHGMLWTSDDAGRSWQHPGQPELEAAYSLPEVTAQGDTALVSTMAGDGAKPQILRSADGGDTWTAASGGPPTGDIEGYAPLWSGGGRFFTVTSTFLQSWDSPEVCYADIELCRQDSVVVLYASEDGEDWQRVDTSGLGTGEDAEVDEAIATDDGRVVAMQVRHEDGILLHTWPANAELPVTDPPGAAPTVEMVEVPENGELEPGVRYHAPLYIHCGMDWLYLGEQAWQRTDDGPDVETGAGDAGDPTWPIAQQTIFGYATLRPDGVVEYSIGDDEVIATYERTSRRPPGCD